MTAPAWTVAADRSETEALLEMLDHGVRHLPVLDAGRRLVGVLDDVDLMASERRAPFRLRAQIARSADAAAVAEAAAELPETVIALYDAELPVRGDQPHDREHPRHDHPPADRDRRARSSGPAGAVHVAGHGQLRPLRAVPELRRRLRAGLGRPGRRSAAAGDDDGARRARSRGLSACGLRPTTQGAVASSPLFARSIDEWERAARGWLEDPDRDRGLMLLSVVVESDPVWGATTAAERLAAAFAAPEPRAGRCAASPPPRWPSGRRPASSATSCSRTSGERKGVLDIKRGGLLPIEALARWAGLAAGVSAASTRARLEAAEAAGVLEAADAAVLRDAFELVCALRMEHQVEQLRAGIAPDDLIDPKRLTPLTRTSLKEAFRAVARCSAASPLKLGFAAR